MNSATFDIIVDAYGRHMKHQKKESIQLIENYRRKNTSSQVKKWCNDTIDGIRTYSGECQILIQSILQKTPHQNDIQEKIGNIFIGHGRVLSLECEGLKNLIQTYESRQ